MNILRARGGEKNGWWEMELLDLDIVADGESEHAMLRDLEHTLTAEYHLAIQASETPFVKLFKGCPMEVSRTWEDGGKSLRQLNLPPDVRQALAAVFRIPKIPEFGVSEFAHAA